MNDRKELIVRLSNGRTIRSGSELRGAGAYVRVCRDDGSELAYWDKQEWVDDPETVMGAILFSAEGITREEAEKGDLPCNEQLHINISPAEADSLLRLLNAAMTCFAGSAGGVLHPLRDRILVANEAYRASKRRLTMNDQGPEPTLEEQLETTKAYLKEMTERCDKAYKSNDARAAKIGKMREAAQRVLKAGGDWLGDMTEKAAADPWADEFMSAMEHMAQVVNNKGLYLTDVVAVQPMKEIPASQVRDLPIPEVERLICDEMYIEEPLKLLVERNLVGFSEIVQERALRLIKVLMYYGETRNKVEKKDHAKDVDKVVKWFESLSFPTQYKTIQELDETIHELFAVQASAVNNAGFVEQVKCVFEQCGARAWHTLGETWDEWEFKS